MRAFAAMADSDRHHEAAMRPCDVTHEDPSALARSAAVRSAREQDPRTRAAARAMDMSERLGVGLELSRIASTLRLRAR